MLTDVDRLACLMAAIRNLGDGTHCHVIAGAFTRSGMEGGRITPRHLKMKVFDIGKPHRSNLPNVTADLLSQMFANPHLIQNVGSEVIYLNINQRNCELMFTF